MPKESDSVIRGYSIEGAANLSRAEMEARVTVTSDRDQVLAALHKAVDEWLEATWPNIDEISLEERQKLTYCLHGAISETKSTFYDIPLSEEGSALLDEIMTESDNVKGRKNRYFMKPISKRVLGCLINEVFGSQNGLTIDDLAELTGYKVASIPEAISKLRCFFEGLEERWTIDGSNQEGVSLSLSECDSAEMQNE